MYAEKLPEDIREAFKAEISKYVQVDSREAAKALLTTNPHFSAEFQSALSLKHEDSMKRFQAEKMPALIEEEIKKRGTKQPWEIEIENLKREAAEKDRQLTLKERRSQAMAELAKFGLDPELADFVLNEDEAQLKSNIEKLTGKVTSWRDAEIKKAGINAFGQKNPPAGSPGSIDFSKMSVTTSVMTLR
jgi:uncharacterized protein YfeS